MKFSSLNGKNGVKSGEGGRWIGGKGGNDTAFSHWEMNR